MTDRHTGYIVTLERDVREDDAEAIIAALRMVKGVIDVAPVPVDQAAHIAQVRADRVWRDRLLRLANGG